MYDLKLEIPFLDLDKMYNSGQCFSWTKINNNKFLIVDGNKRALIKKLNNDIYNISFIKDNNEDDYAYWYNYFNLDLDYSKLYKELYKKALGLNNQYLIDAIAYGYGIRILKQNPWQTIITFIISQNNNMKRIRNSIDILIDEYGSGKFPQSDKLKNINWQKIGVGYRSSYLESLVNNSDFTNIISKINSMPIDELMDYLKSFTGIGNKVASCICLYGMHRLECAPIDTHMKQIINNQFLGINLLNEFPNYQGLIQQWLFDWKTNSN